MGERICEIDYMLPGFPLSRLHLHCNEKCYIQDFLNTLKGYLSLWEKSKEIGLMNKIPGHTELTFLLNKIHMR